jgi:hypothetical protein
MSWRDGHSGHPSLLPLLAAGRDRRSVDGDDGGDFQSLRDPDDCSATLTEIIELPDLAVETGVTQVVLVHTRLTEPIQSQSSRVRLQWVNLERNSQVLNVVS